MPKIEQTALNLNELDAVFIEACNKLTRVAKTAQRLSKTMRISQSVDKLGKMMAADKEVAKTVEANRVRL